MSSASESIETASRLSAFIESLLKFLQACIMAAGGGGMVLLLIGPALATSSNGFILLAVLAPLILFLSLLVHEAGHALTATLSKMTVLQLRVGPLVCVMQQRVVRIRWQPLQEMRRARLGGFVLAIPDLDRSLRKQQILYALGGPLANLVVALLSTIIGYATLPHLIAFVGFAVAWINFIMAIGNLVPTKRVIGSDGKKLVEWLRAKERKVTPYQQLVALSIQGKIANELPAGVVEALDVQPAPMPLVALYMRLQMHENSAQWSAASALEENLDRILSNTPQAIARAFSNFLAIIQTELAFSKAMRDENSLHLRDDLLPSATAWQVPYLLPRCKALREALTGNIPQRDHQLGLAMHQAEKSMERSVARREALLGDYIRAI